jgi:hypothetical protein
VTDGEYHIVVISISVPGATNDKKLSDEVKTVDRLPDGCKANADKGDQGLDKQVSLVTVMIKSRTSMNLALHVANRPKERRA